MKRRRKRNIGKKIRKWRRERDMGRSERQKRIGEEGNRRK